MVFKQDDFTEQAQEAIGASYDVVRRFKHPQWDVEHVVLAVLEIESSVPVQLLGELGVDVNRVREDIEQVLKDTPKVNVQGPQIHPTPRAQELLPALVFASRAPRFGRERPRGRPVCPPVPQRSRGGRVEKSLARSAARLFIWRQVRTGIGLRRARRGEGP